MSRKQQVVLTKVNINYILAKKIKLSKYGMGRSAGQRLMGKQAPHMTII